MYRLRVHRVRRKRQCQQLRHRQSGNRPHLRLYDGKQDVVSQCCYNAGGFVTIIYEFEPIKRSNISIQAK